MPESTTPQSRRISDRAALTPIALLIGVWTMGGTVAALRWAGQDIPAIVVGYLTVPVAAAGMASTAWVFFRFLEAMADIRREREKVERSSGGDSDG